MMCDVESVTEARRTDERWELQRLRAENEALRKDAERWRFQERQMDLTPYLREYHSGVCLSTADIDAAMKEGK